MTLQIFIGCIVFSSCNLTQVYPKWSVVMKEVCKKSANGTYTGTFKFLTEQDRVNTLSEFEKRFAEVKSYEVVIAAAALDPEYWSEDFSPEADAYVTPALHMVVKRLLGQDQLAAFVMQYENWRMKRAGFSWEEHAR